MSETKNAIDIVRRFWALMQTNDFYAVGTVLSDDFVLTWPQSKERIRGVPNFAQMNAEYPAQGNWTFTIHRLFSDADGQQVVSDVSVSDGAQHGRAISFFTVANGKITHIVEFWPEPFEAPANRQHLVEHFVDEFAG